MTESPPALRYYVYDSKGKTHKHPPTTQKITHCVVTHLKDKRKPLVAWFTEYLEAEITETKRLTISGSRVELIKAKVDLRRLPPPGTYRPYVVVDAEGQRHRHRPTEQRFTHCIVIKFQDAKTVAEWVTSLVDYDEFIKSWRRTGRKILSIEVLEPRRRLKATK